MNDLVETPVAGLHYLIHVFVIPPPETDRNAFLLLSWLSADAVQGAELLQSAEKHCQKKNVSSQSLSCEVSVHVFYVTWWNYDYKKDKSGSKPVLKVLSEHVDSCVFQVGRHECKCVVYSESWAHCAAITPDRKCLKRQAVDSCVALDWSFQKQPWWLRI